MINKKIEISYKTVVFTIFFLLLLVLLWQVRNIIVLLFISFVLMEALNPAIIRLEKIKIPKGRGILIFSKRTTAGFNASIKTELMKSKITRDLICHKRTSPKIKMIVKTTVL